MSGKTQQLILLSFLTLCGSREVVANELQLTLGLEGQRTSWQEQSGSGTLRFSYSWWRNWSVFALGEAGYAQKDQRFLEHVQVGVEGRFSLGSTRPYARAGFSHQHEISSDYLAYDPGSALGLGDGIRHRGGLGGALGLQFPLRRHHRGDYFWAVELTGDRLFGAVGPKLSFGLGVAAGFTFESR